MKKVIALLFERPLALVVGQKVQSPFCDDFGNVARFAGTAKVAEILASAEVNCDVVVIKTKDRDARVACEWTRVEIMRPGGSEEIARPPRALFERREPGERLQRRLGETFPALAARIQPMLNPGQIGRPTEQGHELFCVEQGWDGLSLPPIGWPVYRAIACWTPATPAADVEDRLERNAAR